MSCRIVTGASGCGWETDTFVVRMRPFAVITWNPNNCIVMMIISCLVTDTFVHIHSTSSSPSSINSTLIRCSLVLLFM